MIQSNEQLRLAKMESICDKLRSEMDDVLQKAYEIAVEEQDEDRAAELARKIRNKLLDASDKHCTFDKILPPAPEGTNFADWLDWLKSLAQVASGAWGKYRQALRDLTEQPGFPFEVTFPVPPEEDAEREGEENG